MSLKSRKRKENSINITIMLLFTIILLFFVVRIRKINIIGNTKYNNEQIIEMILDGKNNEFSTLLFIKNTFIKHKHINFIDKYEIEWINPFDINIIIYEKPIVGYIRYMSTNFYFDKDGYITEISNEMKNKVPEFKGMFFENLSINTQISISDKNILNSMLNITENISHYNLDVYLVEYNTINDIKAYIAGIEVLLGNNENMEIKFSTLNDIYPQISELNGTLDLSNARENMLNEQYIFKKRN